MLLNPAGIEKQTIPCHLLLLASLSDFLQSLLGRDLAPGPQRHPQAPCATVTYVMQ